ncbi:MAG: hypothetical protein RLZ10_239 [Bacteroidota bacterium]|jgi:hypothetical protein
MKHSFLKDIVFIGLLTLVIGGVCEYLQGNDWDYTSLIKGDLFKQRPVETTSMNTYDDVVFIKGLGNVSNSDLELSKSIIETYYGVSCVIDGSVPVDNSILYDGTNKLSSHVAAVNLAISGKKVIYVTNEELIDTDSGRKLLGYTIRLGGKTVIARTKHLKSTLIHEYAHTLRLEHCPNEGCALSEGHNEELCSDCKNKINM